MLASAFVYGGIQAIKNADALAVKAKRVNGEIRGLAEKVAPGLPIPTDDVLLVRANAAVQIGAGLALATGRAPRLSAAVLAVSTVPTTAAGHPFWEEHDKSARAAQTTHFLKNISMLGGLVLAALDTDGKPGVAWRAQHAVGTAKREAKHLRREAKQQAKIARANVR